MKSEAQYKLIADVALSKFRAFGIRRVTLDEIARELRISKKTIYQHYPSKEDLVKACTVNIRERVFPAVQAAINGQSSISERVMAVWQELGEIPRTVTREFTADLKAEYPHIWTEIETQRRSVIASMESLFREGIEHGEIWPDIHPRVAVRVLLAVLDNIFVPEVMFQGEFTIVEALNTVMILMIRSSLIEPPVVHRCD